MKCLISIQTCMACQSTSCIADPAASIASANSAKPQESGPNVGAIAGGVIGGVVAIAVVVYLVWRFFIKNKRAQYQSEYVEQYADDATEAEKDFSARRADRASTHTVGSIASTVLTRASNIIQIAYIPGVTNRSAPSTPGLLVPPVPPIPAGVSSTGAGYQDQHFFLPGDLRDSTYSAMTDRTSYAPRSSVASTIYGKHAVVAPMPAQTVVRGKAAVISVNKAASAAAPPVPVIDVAKYKHTPTNMEPPPSPAFSVGSTFLNSASAATQMRPTVVRVVPGSSGSRGSKPENPKAPATTEEASSADEHEAESPTVTIIDDTPSPEQGPFGDPPPRALGHTKNGSLSAVIEVATLKAQGEARASAAAKKKKEEETPFGDEHATD